MEMAKILRLSILNEAFEKFFSGEVFLIQKFCKVNTWPGGSKC